MKYLFSIIVFLFSTVPSYSQTTFDGLWIERYKDIEIGYKGATTLPDTHPDLFNHNWTVHLLDIQSKNVALKLLGKTTLDLESKVEGQKMLLKSANYNFEAKRIGEYLELICLDRVGQVKRIVFERIVASETVPDVIELENLLLDYNWELHYYNKRGEEELFDFDNGEVYLMSFEGKSQQSFYADSIVSFMQQKDSLYHVTSDKWRIDTFRKLNFLIINEPGKLTNSNTLITGWDSNQRVLKGKSYDLFNLMSEHTDYAIEMKGDSLIPADSLEAQVIGRWRYDFNFNEDEIENQIVAQPYLELIIKPTGSCAITVNTPRILLDKKAYPKAQKPWTFVVEGKWFAGKDGQSLFLDFALEALAKPIYIDLNTKNQIQIEDQKESGHAIFLELFSKVNDLFYEEYEHFFLDVGDWYEHPRIKRLEFVRVIK